MENQTEQLRRLEKLSQQLQESFSIDKFVFEADVLLEEAKDDFGEQLDVEDAVEQDDQQDQYVTIVPSLVNSRYKAKAFSNERKDEQCRYQVVQSAASYLQRLENEVSHGIFVMEMPIGMYMCCACLIAT